jgi:hypothetical protein
MSTSVHLRLAADSAERGALLDSASAGYSALRVLRHADRFHRWPVRQLEWPQHRHAEDPDRQIQIDQ